MKESLLKLLFETSMQNRKIKIKRDVYEMCMKNK